MLLYTIGQVLDMKGEKPYGSNYYIYLYRDDKTSLALYVGKSAYPIRRLRQHWISDAKSRIGAIIRENQPDSLNWLVEIYNITECSSFVLTYEPKQYEIYQTCLETESQVFNSAIIAERAMIAHYQPSYNKNGKNVRI